MSTAHSYIGLALAGVFLLIFLSGLLFWIINRDPGRVFWAMLGAGQIGLGLFALTGIVMFILRRPELNIDRILHFLYGLFPFLVLFYAHRFARRAESVAWGAFAVAGLIVFGLLVRGYMTG